MCRTFTILALTLAVFAAGSLGLNSGMVLAFDEDHGHPTFELPQLRHAHEHAEGADHEAHDHGDDADHAELHDLIGSTSNSHLTTQKVDQSSSSTLAAAQQCLSALDIFIPDPLGSLLRPPSSGALRDALNFPGGTAHVDLACLRSVVLLV